MILIKKQLKKNKKKVYQEEIIIKKIKVYMKIFLINYIRKQKLINNYQKDLVILVIEWII